MSETVYGKGIKIKKETSIHTNITYYLRITFDRLSLSSDRHVNIMSVYTIELSTHASGVHLYTHLLNTAITTIRRKLNVMASETPLERKADWPDSTFCQRLKMKYRVAISYRKMSETRKYDIVGHLILFSRKNHYSKIKW